MCLTEKGGALRIGDHDVTEVTKNTPGNNYEEESYTTREARDKRWEELMLVKPHVFRATSWVPFTTDEGKASHRTVWLVLYPRYAEAEPLGRNEEMGRTDVPEEAEPVTSGSDQVSTAS